MSGSTNAADGAYGAVEVSKENLTIAYRQWLPPKGLHLGTALLIHGFPQTSYQWRFVGAQLAAQGYHCIAPDYTGAGNSSKPTDQNMYRKSAIARVLVGFLDALKITGKFHVIGHDIGGMIAWSLAAQYPGRLKTLCWGECPLPGTPAYVADTTIHAKIQFHFVFHSVQELPEILLSGKERQYLEHFFTKKEQNLVFTPEVIDYYAEAYSQPGAMSAGINLYRMFDQDAKENLAHTSEKGPVSVPTLILNGGHSRHSQAHRWDRVEDTLTQKGLVTHHVIPSAGHWLAEEDPTAVVEVLLGFFARVDSH